MVITRRTDPLVPLLSKYVSAIVLIYSCLCVYRPGHRSPVPFRRAVCGKTHAVRTVPYTITNSADDSRPYDRFSRVSVDGTVISSDYYTTAKGSLVLTLKSAYLNTLTAGEHTVKFSFTDGEVSSSLKILSNFFCFFALPEIPCLLRRQLPRGGHGSPSSGTPAKSSGNRYWLPELLFLPGWLPELKNRNSGIVTGHPQYQGHPEY